MTVIEEELPSINVEETESIEIGSGSKDSNKDMRNTMAEHLEVGNDRGASMNESNLLDSIANPLDSDYNRMGSLNSEQRY